MTRASEREIDYSALEDIPGDVTDLSQDELEQLHESGIRRELRIIRKVIQTARQKKSRVPVKLSAISNNTNSALAFEKGAALWQFLDETGLSDAYMSAPEQTVPGGGDDDWMARFDDPSGPGYFTIIYEEGYVEGVLTHTQKLLYTARA